MKRYLLLMLLTGYSLSGYSQIQEWIAIPELLSSNEIDLQFHDDSVQFFPGTKTHTLGFNQYSYLGPSLELTKGETVTIHVHNNMGDTTNIHWHGLHVSAQNDGGPHTMVMEGETWSPSFTVMNDAATYWYHPHFHHKTAAQAIRGAAGFIIVRDEEEAALGLPSSYGIDDFPIVVQSVQFNNENQPMPYGMQDSTLLVNGSRANYGYEANLNLPAQLVRLRLLNGSGERTFRFGFSNNMNFQIVSSDNGLLNESVAANRIRISPGERYEIVVNLSELQGQSVFLMSYGSEIPMGTQGGPTMPMSSGPNMDSPLNGVDFNILHIHVTEPGANPVSSIPTVLNDLLPFTEASAQFNRPMLMTAPSMMSMDGPFYINGLSYDMEVINFTVDLNTTEIWEVTNQTMVAHPFHLHDVPFYILDRDGNPAPVHERGKKDVVLVEPMETVRFITKFEDFSDTEIPYVYHCHILMHEDDGMMGQFLVVPEGTIDVAESSSSHSLLAYPSPTNGILFLKTTDPSEQVSYTIYDMSGRCMLSHSGRKIPYLDITSLPGGVYLLDMICGDRKMQQRIIKL